MFVFQLAYRYEKAEKLFFVFVDDGLVSNSVCTGYRKRYGER